MSEIFFIGDTHFGHKSIITFEQIKPLRPFTTIEEHDEELVRRWNSAVGPKDRVYHLGDFGWTEKSLEIAAGLNGDKILVMGNHDSFESSKYLKYFRKVAGAYTIGKELILTHIPVHGNQLNRWKYNVHGHLHTDELQDQRYINVSCEQINLTPISYDELRKSGRICD